VKGNQKCCVPNAVDGTDDMLRNGGEEDRNDLFKEIHDISEESFWIVVLTPKYVKTMEMNFKILEL
jgi:hypothetical protein